LSNVPALVHSRHYDIHFFGMERLHPFDSRKYSRAYNVLKRQFGNQLKKHLVPVDRAASHEELCLVHTESYLHSVKRADVCAAALEIPILKRVPGWALRWRVGGPMRWAVRGSVIAATAARERGIAFNLSGGYHHAKPDQGEGFCLYSDIALAIHSIRRVPPNNETSRVVYIDLDAHQGNGVCHHFLDDREVFIFDMYNGRAYPWYDLVAKQRIDCDLPLLPGCQGPEYLATLRERLPPFLDSASRSRPIALAIYNAGTDVFVEDELGGLALSADEILERDLFVIRECRSRRIPLLILPSGGYSRKSYQLIARTAATVLAQDV
jgi:histone deacetylase 11